MSSRAKQAGKGAIVSLRAFLRRWTQKDDDAWKPTGIIQKFSGYDQGKAVQAARRAKELDLKRRDLAQQRAGLGTSAVVTDIASKRGAK